MIQDYLNFYLKKAHCEMIDGGKRFYAEIKELRGVWAVGKNLEECRQNLFSTLEGWLTLRLRKNLSVPKFSFPKSLTKVKAYV